MSLLTKIFSGSASEVINAAGNVLDKLTTTDQERIEAKAEIQKIIIEKNHELALKTEETIQTEITAKADIIKAEMASGDKWTQRARPSIIYSGLLMMGINYVIIPILCIIIRKPIPNLPLPAEFWYSWTAVCGIYSIGRSVEKRGHTNKATKIITGS